MSEPALHRSKAVIISDRIYAQSLSFSLSYESVIGPSLVSLLIISLT